VRVPPVQNLAAMPQDAVQSAYYSASLRSEKRVALDCQSACPGMHKGFGAFSSLGRLVAALLHCGAGYQPAAGCEPASSWTRQPDPLAYSVNPSCSRTPGSDSVVM
jgi:hypothetical protein